MSKNQHAEPEVTIRELLAVVALGGRLVVVLAMVLALILGAMAWLKTTGGDTKQDVEYQLALNAFQVDKFQKEAAIAQLKLDAKNQKTYNEKSLLMKVDAQNKLVTTLTFAISGIEVSSVHESFAADETPISYMTQRVQTQYNTLWKQMDLEKLAEGTAYAGVEETYLREVILFSVAEGGVLSLSVTGNDAVAAEKIIDAIYAVLLESKETVELASYNHDVVILNDISTKASVDTALEKKQLENINKIETGKKEILKLEEELLNMDEPSNPLGMMSVVKKAILGGIVGAALAAVWLVCRYLLKNPVTCSKKMASIFSLTYLGSSARSKTIWARLAKMLMGEYAWRDEAKAAAYIKEKGVAHIPETATVAVVTSLTDLKEESVSQVTEALGGKGRVITFGADALHDAETLALMRQSNGIVLLERAFESKMAVVADVMDMAKELEKPVYGFVMI